MSYIMLSVTKPDQTLILGILKVAGVDEYQNITMVYYLAGVGGTRCTPTDRVLGW